MEQCYPESMPLRCGYIAQSFENIMDGKDYQQGSIEKDGNRPRHSETIQDQEITISRTSYKAKLITTKTNRRKDRRQKIPWPTKKYLDN